jgi:hypothetical protein
MEFAKANTKAHLDFTQELFSVKSPQDGFALWTNHSKTQLETFQAQAKELAEIAQRAAAAAVEPIKASAAKLYPPAA